MSSFIKNDDNDNDDDGLIDLLDEIKSLAPSPRISPASPSPSVSSAIPRSSEEIHILPEGNDELISEIPKWQYAQAAALEYFRSKFANPVCRCF